METAAKPIKRKPELVPLSREHHFGLLFCWKLKQGLAKKTSFAVLRNFVMHFWQTNLKEHLGKEETAVLDKLPASDPLLKQMLQEHTLIRELVQQVENEVQLSGLLFEALRNLVSEHIRFEERQFFPHLEQNLSSLQMAEIGQLLQHDEHQPEPEFEPAFWENKTNVMN